MPLETKITQKNENLGDSALLSLFIRSDVVCETAYASSLEHRLKQYLKVTVMGSMIPKEIKIWCYYMYGQVGETFYGHHMTLAVVK